MTCVEKNSENKVILETTLKQFGAMNVSWNGSVNTTLEHCGAMNVTWNGSVKMKPTYTQIRSTSSNVTFVNTNS